MQLHQLLRCLDANIPIVIFDIQGIEICATFTKDTIDVDLYEYNVLKVELGRLQSYTQIKPALYIMIEK